MGKLIIIKGTDGSGKQTQTGLLYEKLCEIKGREKVRKISFPNYESKASEPVKMYLSREFGEKADSVNAYVEDLTVSQGLLGFRGACRFEAPTAEPILAFSFCAAPEAVPASASDSTFGSSRTK